MEINNPQVFDHIIGINGEILQPKVLLDADIEPAKIQTVPIIWRKTTADEYHVPAAILGANGEILQPKVLTYQEVEPAKIQPEPVIYRKRKADEYHLPIAVIDGGGHKLGLTSGTYNFVNSGNVGDSVCVARNCDDNKYLLPPSIRGANGGILSVKVIEIGVWNMDINSTVPVPHGLTHTKIRSVSGIIISDAGSLYPLYCFVDTAEPGLLAAGIKQIGSSHIIIDRRTGGTFDNVDFDDGVMNRGFITIWFQD